MHWEALEFELPAVKGRRWHMAVDTARPSPCDIVEPGKEELVVAERVKAEGRSVVVLVSR
jgi:glycogen operon protein